MPGRARIFEKPKSAMQSGFAGTSEWILQYEPGDQRRADPLMGWISSGDTQAQLRLCFDSRAAAVAYAEQAGIAYDVELPQARRIKPKAYADNFRFGRLENWTH